MNKVIEEIGEVQQQSPENLEQDCQDIESLICGPEFESTIPTAPDQTENGFHNNRLFRLSRFTLRIQEHLGRTLSTVVKGDLHLIISKWYNRAGEFANNHSKDEYFFEFLRIWEYVRVPLGQNETSEARKAAMKKDLPPEALQFDQQEIQQLVALCCEMQLRHSTIGAFWISCRDAGKEFNVHHSTAAEWLKGLVRCGLLEIVMTGSISGHRRDATVYRYLGKSGNPTQTTQDYSKDNADNADNADRSDAQVVNPSSGENPSDWERMF